MRRFILLFLPFFISFLLFGACGKRRDLHSVLPDSVDLQVGDVVFRLGDSFESDMVVMADRNGTYSHCGIVADSAGNIRIVHAVPDEPDFDGDVDRVKLDRPDMFFRNDRARAGAVCRINDTIAARKAAEAAKAVFFRNTLFDDDYDDKDTTRMYCSELVYFAYKQAGYDLVGDERHTYNVLVRSFDNCIMPSQIYNSPFVHPVALFADN